MGNVKTYFYHTSRAGVSSLQHGAGRPALLPGALQWVSETIRLEFSILGTCNLQLVSVVLNLFFFNIGAFKKHLYFDISNSIIAALQCVSDTVRYDIHLPILSLTTLERVIKPYQGEGIFVSILKPS